MVPSSNPPAAFGRRLGQVRARLHPRCGPELYAAWLERPGALAPADTARTWRGPSPDGRWFVKRRAGRKGWRALEHSLDVGLALEDAGVAACLPLGLLRLGGMTWVVSELLEGRDLALELADAAEAGRS